MEIQCKPFVTAFTVVKFNIYRIVSLKKNYPLAFILCPYYAYNATWKSMVDQFFGLKIKCLNPR